LLDSQVYSSIFGFNHILYAPNQPAAGQLAKMETSKIKLLIYFLDLRGACRLVAKSDPGHAMPMSVIIGNDSEAIANATGGHS
jgi:hypothetical protein